MKKSNAESVRIGLDYASRMLADPDGMKLKIRKKDRDGLISLQRFVAFTLAVGDSIPRDALEEILRGPIELQFGDGVVEKLEIVRDE